MTVSYQLDDTVNEAEVVELYKANTGSSAQKSLTLLKAVRGSHSLSTARLAGKLVGLGNAISDGHLVVNYPHMLVHPDYHRRGIGSGIIRKMQERYAGFHQQSLIADSDAVAFYKSLGFERSGRTEPMWIFDGDEH